MNTLHSEKNVKAVDLNRDISLVSRMDVFFPKASISTETEKPQRAKAAQQYSFILSFLSILQCTVP
jgi:hypothetical protein